MAEALLVERAGHATVQDLGRPGHAHLGISANGAADAHAARVANVLVGNHSGAPVIEATGSAVAFRARRRLLVAVTGAAGRVLLEGTPCRAGEPLVVEEGSRVAVELASAGHRTYVAVNGGLTGSTVLDSVAPDPPLGVGRRLAAGDVVHAESRFQSLDHPFSRVPLFRLGAPLPALRDRLTVDVTPGPDADEFERALDDSPCGTFTVSAHSDQIGLRLVGAAPRRTRSREILSRGVPVGAVEAPPSGGLILLLRGRFVTAGYPIVAIATATAIDELGQARPGDRIVFRTRTVAGAITALRRREDELSRLAARVGNAFRHVGLEHVLDPQHLSAAAGSP
jgi:biotin-dependent carboxylase-like uncharacterized protein